MSFPSLPYELILVVAENLDEFELANLFEAYPHLTLLLPLIKNLVLIPLLCWATSKQFKGIAKTLLDAGDDINASDSDWFDRTPLFYAISAQDIDMILFLLEHGAEVEVYDHLGDTPFHFNASFHGDDNITILEILLNHGCRVDQVSHIKQQTALQIALSEGNASTAEYLLEQGASRGSCCGEGKSVLHYAVEASLVSIVKLLLDEDVEFDVRDEKGNTPLHHAASKNAESDDAREVIQLLLEADNNSYWDTNTLLETVNDAGDTALHIAAENLGGDGCGDISIVNMLLSQGGEDIFTMNYDGELPLQIVRERGFRFQAISGIFPGMFD